MTEMHGRRTEERTEMGIGQKKELR